MNSLSLEPYEQKVHIDINNMKCALEPARSDSTQIGLAFGARPIITR